MATKVIALLLYLIVVADRATSKSRNYHDATRTRTKCIKCPDVSKKLNSTYYNYCLSTRHCQDANITKICKEIAHALFSNHSNVTTTITDSQCITTTKNSIATVSWCDPTVKTTPTLTQTVSICPSSSVTIVLQTSSITTTTTASHARTSAAANHIQFTPVNMVIVGLLGLSLLLLVVVTTAWVCTCLITKKRNRINMEVTTDDTTDFTEKYFENPTYDGTSMIRIHSKPSQGVNRVPVLPVAVRQHAHQQASSQAAFSGAGTTYDAVNTASPKAAGNGQTYDVLDRGKSNCTARKSARAPKGYSQLGVPDKGIVDNKYHLIGREND